MSKRLAYLESLTSSGTADSFAWYALGLEYRGAGRVDDALRTFTTLRANDPGYVAMYLMAGQMLLQAGRRDEASAWVREGIAQATRKHESHALGELETLLAEIGSTTPA